MELRSLHHALARLGQYSRGGDPIEGDVLPLPMRLKHCWGKMLLLRRGFAWNLQG